MIGQSAKVLETIISSLIISITNDSHAQLKYYQILMTLVIDIFDICT